MYLRNGVRNHLTYTSKCERAGMFVCKDGCVLYWANCDEVAYTQSKEAGVFLHLAVDSMLVGGCQCEYRAEGTFCLPFIIQHRFSAISHVSPQRGRCAVTDSYCWQENSLSCLRICRTFIWQSGTLREKSTLVRSWTYYQAGMNCSFSSIEMMISWVGHYFEQDGQSNPVSKLVYQ